jgi:hypothetical protein
MNPLDRYLHHDHERRHVVKNGGEESIFVMLQKSLLVFRQSLVAVQQVLDVAVHTDQLAFAGDSI